MKKLAVVLASVAILAIGAVGVAAAQTPTPAWGGCGFGTGAGQDGYDPTSSPVVRELAKTIGVEPADLVAQVKGGKSVADVAREKGVPVEKLVEVVQAPMVEMMKIMSRYGYADEAQIASMLEYMSEYNKSALEQPGVLGGGMMGGMMGAGMMGGMMGGAGSMMGGWQTRTN